MRCEKCNRIFHSKRLEKHKERCESLPTGDELFNMLSHRISLTKIATKYNTNTEQIRAIVLASGHNMNDIVRVYTRECHICGASRSRKVEEHIRVCEGVNLEELERKMRHDPAASATTLARELKLDFVRLKAILKHSLGWTKRDIRAKGMAAMAHNKSAKIGSYDTSYLYYPRCERCEIVVKKGAVLCDWCISEGHVPNRHSSDDSQVSDIDSQ